MVQLINDDCIVAMKSIDDESIDFVVTSPPYYNAREYAQYQSYQQYLDVWEVMCKSKEPINPADAIFSMVAYKIKEWLQEKTNKIGVKVQKLGYISFNYEHDDDLDGISYVEELLGLEDYGYIEEGKLKPLDKNSNYKAQFNY